MMICHQNRGIDWAVEKGYAWPEDKEHCEEHGRMAEADAKKVSDRAKQRGKLQVPFAFFCHPRLRQNMRYDCTAWYSWCWQSLSGGSSGGRNL
jgi:hypothetical protein